MNETPKETMGMESRRLDRKTLSRAFEMRPPVGEWKCLECGKVFRTVRAAERASMNGCPKCGGVDIDLA